jgi:1,4-alpha-glucan branching enzyme
MFFTGLPCQIRCAMILTHDEVRSLVDALHRSPHQLLGMHPLGDGAGVVVRALLPNAASVEIAPTHEKKKPSLKLERLHECGLFEGVTRQSQRVYAYDLIVKDYQGSVRRTRDAYSFLPTLGETDLYLFGQGNERRIYEKLGAQIRVIDGVPGTSFAVWAPNAQRVSVVGAFNNWDGRYHPMRLLGASGVWELFVPGIGEGTLYKYEIKDLHGPWKMFGGQIPDPRCAVAQHDHLLRLRESTIQCQLVEHPTKATLGCATSHIAHTVLCWCIHIHARGQL